MEEDETREFYFESDHLALRNNYDYRILLKYIVSLECRKIMVIKDIESLQNIQKTALEDPLKFIEALSNGNIDLPLSLPVPEIPTINWPKYGITENVLNLFKEKLDSEQENSSNILIRGRAFDQSKPQTFNQLWTCEEQKRLEELLKEFPEEEVDMRRWVKIANALGNRTPKQVMSRVQKYFLKLQRAGLPIPGRTTRRTGITYRNQRSSKIFRKKSTFFPAQHVPVLMDEDNGEIEPKLEYEESKEWTQLELMQAVYERKKIEEVHEEKSLIHTGISCSNCKCEEIIGTRWVDGIGNNWCSDCLIEYQPTTRMTPVTSIGSI